MSELGNDIEKGVEFFKQELALYKIHHKYAYVICSIVVIAICLFFFRECQHRKDVDELVKNISTYSDSAKHYKSKYGEVSYNKTLQFDNQKQLESYIASNDTLKQLLKKYKNTNSVTIIKDKVFIHDTIPIPFETKIPCNFNAFKIRSHKDSLNYKFVGTLFPNKFLIDTILLNNKQTVVDGYKKIGLFKKEHRIEILNSNPYIVVSNIGGYVVKDKPKRFGLGFSVGYGFGVRQNAVYLNPFIGVSANYNIISF
jgi:hypothetical protein